MVPICSAGNGAGNRNRTRDPLITNQVLYQLSYTGSGTSRAFASNDAEGPAFGAGESIVERRG